MAPIWLSKAVVLAVHEKLLAEHGGSAGLRDSGLLDSALARPRQLHAYGAPDTCDSATAYAAGIIRNHPFVDGNKRTGFMCAYLFLAENGFRLPYQVERTILGIKKAHPSCGAPITRASSSSATAATAIP